MESSGEVIVNTDAFDDDLEALRAEYGFQLRMIFPADAPAEAVLTGFGLTVRLVRAHRSTPATLRFPTDSAPSAERLPGGTELQFVPSTDELDIPDAAPELVVTDPDDKAGVGRAGMRYRDLLPGRWGGRFISSHITIADGGPVPDYVHYHRIRFQMIFVKAGWVRVVYEDQGDPFVLHAGDCVLQPPEIRHRVLESSPGLEVIEVTCPAEHHTFTDPDLALPNDTLDPDRDFSGQRFVRHVAADAEYVPWRLDGWECRVTGIGAATSGLAGVRVARPADGPSTVPVAVSHSAEFVQLVVLSGDVDLVVDDDREMRMRTGACATIPSGRSYALLHPTSDCEVLDITLPADVIR